MEFGEKLQNLRKASNLNQEQLADMLNVSRQSVSKWESGATYPEMDKLIAMAKIFKCSMDDLVNNEVKDKEIVTNKNNVVNEYVDSLLNFVVDTVNMFFSMKFTTLIKSLIEIFIIGFVLFGGSIFIAVGTYEFFDFLNLSGNIFGVMAMFIFFVLVFGLAIFSVVAFLQIFKIRYLDYYRKAVYKEAQIRDLKLEINNKSPEIEEKRKYEFRKVKEPVVIVRDSNGSNLKFLEKFVEWLKRAMTIFVVAVLVCVSFPSSVVLIVSLVICLYLLSVNSIFFGIVLGIIGLLIICYELLELIYILLTEKIAPVKRWAIMFLIALVISSVGAGLSLIKLKDIKFVDNYGKSTILSESLEFKDDLIITSETGRTIYFVVDDESKNVKVDVEYNKEFMGVSLIDRRDAKFISFDYKNYSSYNAINQLLDGLKNNIFYSEYYDRYTNIKITSNESNVKKLINNLADRYLIYTIKNEDGYAVEIETVKSNLDMCNFDQDGIKRCYRVYDGSYCDVRVDSNGKIRAYNDKCICNLEHDEYYCYRREE